MVSLYDNVIALCWLIKAQWCIYAWVNKYQWLNARLQYLQCFSDGDTAVLHQAIDIYHWSPSSFEEIFFSIISNSGFRKSIFNNFEFRNNITAKFCMLHWEQCCQFICKKNYDALTNTFQIITSTKLKFVKICDTKFHKFYFSTYPLLHPWSMHWGMLHLPHTLTW